MFNLSIGSRDRQISVNLKPDWFTWYLLDQPVTHCGGLNENVPTGPHGLTYLSTWFLVAGTVWGKK